MRILQVCPFSVGNRRGGVSEHVWNISTQLAKHSNVTLYGLRPNSKYPRFEVVDGVSIENFKHYYPDNSYYFSVELPTRLRQVEFDVVHSHGYNTLPMHYAALAKCRKFIVTTHFHGEGHSAINNLFFPLFRPLGKTTLTKADFIVAVSNFEKHLLSNQFSFGSDKIKVIPNGVTLSDFVSLKRIPSSNCKTILTVGRLEQYKGIQYLLDVMPKLDSNIVLEIVGNGPFKHFLQEHAKQNGVHKRVKFFNRLPRNELLQKYVNADLFVTLSSIESYSIVVAEALAAGTPCIVTKTSALTEWVDNRSCFGIDLPINNDRLYSLITDVLGETDGKKVTTTWFGSKILDWSEVARRLEQLYA